MTRVRAQAVLPAVEAVETGFAPVTARAETGTLTAALE